MSASPVIQLGVGDRFTITITITNREPRALRDVGASVLVGDGATVRVVDLDGGVVNEVCDGHDPSSLQPVCRSYGAEWRNLAIEPRGKEVRTLTIEIVDFACPGGGDFQHLVYATLTGPVRRGFNGGSYRVWYENEPEDYAGRRGDRTDVGSLPGARGQCVSETVN